MKIFIAVMLFCLGISIGSFLNVVVYRLPRKLNMVSGRSFCPNCEHQLSALDLVPLFSFLFLKGRCRYCKVRISNEYFIIEFINGFFFVIFYLIYGLNQTSISYMLLLSVLIPITRIDDKHSVIPNILVAYVALISLYLGVIVFETKFLISVTISVIISSPYIVASLISRWRRHRTFGLGDIKLVFSLGFSITFDTIYYFIYLTMLILFGKILIDITLQKNKKVTFPFARYIVISYIIVILIAKYF